MPFIRVTLSGDVPAPCRADIAAGVTDLMAAVLHKKAALTSVLVESIPQAGWTIGGEPVAKAAHLEANITAGTNTEEEKERFVGDAATLLGRLLGGLPEATYVIIREIPATDWGYDGRTQASRRISRS